jgi:hypothetical protein
LFNTPGCGLVGLYLLARNDICTFAHSEAAEKMTCFVILSEAKNLSSTYVSENKPREILRFAENDSVLSFSVAW